MTISISLSAESERLLRERAAARGLPADQYVVQIVEASLQSPKTWRQAMAPLQDALDEPDVSEAERDRLLEEARENAWKEEQRKRAS